MYSADEVRAAIANGEIINHYQPIVSVAAGQVLGMEALARWLHPVDGMVYPDQFIGVAEENGLIHDLTRAVIEKALAQANAWKSETGLALQMNINASMDILSVLGFADYLAEQAAASGVPPTKVTLEVTESRLMSNPRIALDVLTRLRLKHFRISIDDFGTGHSSLAQLRDIPFDELKIDRGFVHGAGIDRTVRAIFNMSVMLGKQLGMCIVAEGIEDQADWDFVRSSRCDLAQGYFIARPMPGEALHNWIKDWGDRSPERSRGPGSAHGRNRFPQGTDQLESLAASAVDVTKQREPAGLENAIACAIARLTGAKSLTFYHLQSDKSDIYAVPSLHLADGMGVAIADAGLKPVALSGDTPIGDQLRKSLLPRAFDPVDELESELILPFKAARGDIAGYCQIKNTRVDISMHSVLPLLLEFYTNYLSLLHDNERDILTGLLNRKTFDLRVSKILAALQETHKRTSDRAAPDQCCIAILDIDHFKRINDTFGHAYGDEVLLLFSKLMKENFRGNDLLFRFGGEEFVVLLTAVNSENACRSLERFRTSVEKYKFPGIGQVTVSIGLTTMARGEQPRTTVDRADQALYFAKENGRNQTCIYESLLQQGLLKQQNIKTGEIELF